MNFHWMAVILGAALAVQPGLRSQPAKANYDESKAGGQDLPDPLKMENGEMVRGGKMWRDKRRPELLRLFETHVYGRTPDKKLSVRYQLMSEEKNALDGKAIRREISILFTDEPSRPRIDLLLYLPKERNGPVPVFAGLNFWGNQGVDPNPGIKISTNWMRPNTALGIVNNRATEKTRGAEASRWPVKKIIEAGYGLATAFYGDIDPDYNDGYKNGVQPLFYKPGQTEPARDEWGSIGAWAWGLSRILDYLETEPSINRKQVAVLGHSRLGKTALWAGAQDERFAIVISNNSGCGGAALSRRIFGETVADINRLAPHWFCSNFKEYNNNEQQLPVDQHELVALMAPRPVYVASAEEDLWADPKGEFLSLKHADPVYKLLGTDGLPVQEMPSMNQPVMGRVGYHIRSGKHDLTEYDWDQFIRFSNLHFKRQ